MSVSGLVKHLRFYPVKSASGIELNSCSISPDGLSVGRYRDREYMIVREQPGFDGVLDFITQRDKRDRTDQPQGLSILSQIVPQISDDTLKLTWKGLDSIDVIHEITKASERSVRIHHQVVFAVDMGDILSDWLSDHLHMRVRLVRASGRFNRRARQDYLQNESKISFQDAYPIHWFSIESVKELSEKAGMDIPWQSFRPQIVVKGLNANDEHKFHRGEMNGISFLNAKPCDRCPVTKVDQETGCVRVSEPLKTLGRYKRWINKYGEKQVIFGESMLPLDSGIITTGDHIKMKSHREPPLPFF